MCRLWRMNECFARCFWDMCPSWWRRGVELKWVYNSTTGKSSDKRAFTWEVPQKLTVSLPFYLHITNSNRRWIRCRVVSKSGRFTTASAEGGRRWWHSNHTHFSQCLWYANIVQLKCRHILEQPVDENGREFAFVWNAQIPFLRPTVRLKKWM